MTPAKTLQIVEAALLAAGRSLRMEDLLALFDGVDDAPDRKAVRVAVETLADDWEGRAIELVKVAGGYRAQVRAEVSDYIGRLWSERPARYSRALLETLALVAYRQPVTRGEIEEVRGVSVATSIINTLLERDWVRVLGHREVPGRPAIYGTTRNFLDTFGLQSLDELPPLDELRDLDRVPDLFSDPGVVDTEPGRGGERPPEAVVPGSGEDPPGGSVQTREPARDRMPARRDADSGKAPGAAAGSSGTPPRT